MPLPVQGMHIILTSHLIANGTFPCVSWKCSVGALCWLYSVILSLGSVQPSVDTEYGTKIGNPVNKLQPSQHQKWAAADIPNGHLGKRNTIKKTNKKTDISRSAWNTLWICKKKRPKNTNIDNRYFIRNTIVFFCFLFAFLKKGWTSKVLIPPRL